MGKPLDQPKDKLELLPASILRWPENTTEYAVLVDKSAQKLFVYHRGDPSTPIREFTVSTGENEGQKREKNDRKTPEGIYFFTNSFVEKDLAPIYGIRAFPIDYPNTIDQKAGRRGYGIWFHGTNKPLKPRDTNGCVALENHDIDQLASYLKLDDTPVIISSKIKMEPPSKLRKETETLEKLIEGWRQAWEGKEIDRYMSFYSQGFTSGRKNRRQWKEYKARLAKEYEQIRVDIEDLQLFRNDGVVLARFRQKYQTPTFTSLGEKRLYLKQNSAQWRIIAEVFAGDEKTHITSIKRPVSISEEIKEFIDMWREAWEKKDVETYISCYDATFRSRGMDIKAWKSHRESLNGKFRSYHIDIEDLKLVRISDSAAKVKFRQDYQADSYRDSGMKEMFLIKEGKRWKIKGEEWRPLRKRSRR